jgi:hypothetical protein
MVRIQRILDGLVEKASRETDHVELGKIGKEIAEAQRSLAAAEDAWLEAAAGDGS